ncbi:LOW QUALITY PROTEIN: uncharacterized protein LOC143216514 [Lasioglossum baleicum]|uniref:LOW QUALITY PROTEIN: uncharacterized protein LOC143216514 n=1 Tax=Lasioglossum baleicum TaxID=434251 RepID=UPI003FCC3B31
MARTHISSANQETYIKVIKGHKRRRATCNFKIRALHGTWFEKVHINIAKICRFIAYFLLLKPPRYFCMINELELSDRDVVDWIKKQILYTIDTILLQQWILTKQESIGGPGKIVEVDEIKIGKRKYNRGRMLRGQWLLGGIERNTKKVFVLPVPDRTTETLISINRKHIVANSIIHTDNWRAYNGLTNENYCIHETVNHSTNFVDPQTGVHTQNIERLWRDLRASIPRYGIRDYHYNNYIAEFLFKRTYNFDKRIDAFFEIMNSMYPLDHSAGPLRHPRHLILTNSDCMIFPLLVQILYEGYMYRMLYRVFQNS